MRAQNIILFVSLWLYCIILRVRVCLCPVFLLLLIVLRLYVAMHACSHVRVCVFVCVRVSVCSCLCVNLCRNREPAARLAGRPSPLCTAYILSYIPVEYIEYISYMEGRPCLSTDSYPMSNRVGDTLLLKKRDRRHYNDPPPCMHVCMYYVCVQ